MNKYQRLTKDIIKVAIKCGIAVAVAGAIYAAASMYAGDVLKQKTDAESKFSQEDALLNNLRGQMDKSGEAEKKFVELQSGRTVEDFSSNFESFQNFLKSAKDRYRLSIELLPAKEVPTDKAELKNFSYEVMLRPKIELTVKAISDVHVFSFIDDLKHKAPGLVHIDRVKITRNIGGTTKVDLTDDTINRLKSGGSDQLVEATILLTWIRFVPKETKQAAAPAPTTP